MAASLRCSVFSEGTRALKQILAGRKQQNIQPGRGQGSPPNARQVRGGMPLL
jgi:hypothetical protein